MRDTAKAIINDGPFGRDVIQIRGIRGTGSVALYEGTRSHKTAALSVEIASVP